MYVPIVGVNAFDLQHGMVLLEILPTFGKSPAGVRPD
jgi:hypothetical protein